MLTKDTRTAVGIWGDLVKRNRPSLQEEATSAALQTLPPAPAATEPETELVIPPPPDGRPSLVVLTPALSRPLVLPPLAEDPPAPPPKLPPPSPIPTTARRVPLPELGESLPTLLDRIRTGERPTNALYTPEQAVAFLSGLPAHLSVAARQARMQRELATIAPDHPQIASELVGDAASKLVELRRDLHTGEIAHSNQQKVDQSRIDAIETELLRLRAEYDTRESAFQKKRQELLTRIDEMTGVIVFFDAFQAQPAPAPASDTGELPAFLKEETAARLLGIPVRD